MCSCPMQRSWALAYFGSPSVVTKSLSSEVSPQQHLKTMSVTSGEAKIRSEGWKQGAGVVFKMELVHVWSGLEDS